MNILYLLQPSSMRLKTLFSKSDWPLYAVLPIFLLPILINSHDVLQQTNGIFSLPHDESFLLLSTAKNLAFRHVWGICSYDFAAASPSLLYPLLLAVFFFIFGAHLLIAVLINTAIGIFLLSAVQRWLKAQGLQPIVQLLILLAIILLTPLPLIVMYGLERILLLLFAFLFISRLSDEWSAASFSRRTYVYGALLVATRYDGILLVTLICLLLLFHRRGWLSLRLWLTSLSPVAAFGLLAISKGWYFIPNTFIVPAESFLLSYDWLIGSAIAVVVPLLLRHAPRLFHRNNRPAQWVTGIAAMAVIGLLLSRNLHAFEKASRSSIRLYRQQYLAGQFARRYYRRRGIASDEVGAVSYLADGRFFDLSGLASIKVAKSKNALSPDSLRRLSQEVSTQLAIVSDSYTRKLPASWIKTGSWDIPRFDRPGKDILSFYVVDPSWAPEMKRNLEEYRRLLPGDITVRY